MKWLVDAYKKKTESSKNPATSTMPDVVIESGVEEESDEHYYATQLIIKKEYRDVFITLKTPTGKLACLKRTWDDRKKN
jgi:hypothetical protein